MESTKFDVGPRFSVILPTHNRAGVVRNAIASVLAQADGDFELIVIDDGSTDGTSEMLARAVGDPRVKILRRENGGPARARNTALAHARGRFVAFIDSDDTWRPEHLATRRRHLARSRRVDFLLGGVECVGSPLLPDKFDPTRLVDVRSLYGVCGTFVVRRELLVKVGGFPEVAYSEDGDLMRKLLSEARVARRVRDVTYLYDRTRDDSICNVLQKLHAQPRERDLVRFARPQQPGRAHAIARPLELPATPSLLPRRPSALPPPVSALDTSALYCPPNLTRP